jgi:hypothetical protein
VTEEATGAVGSGDFCGLREKRKTDSMLEEKVMEEGQDYKV